MKLLITLQSLEIYFNAYEHFFHTDDLQKTKTGLSVEHDFLHGHVTCVSLHTKFQNYDL